MSKTVGKPWSFTAVSEGRARALDLAKRIAHSSCSVLILGLTGVGKDVLAHDIHNHSPRARGRLVAVNCAALTTSLLESELFGHERGAYTNAMTSKTGLVELADGGTLFLDEVGELSREAQAKLLRFLSSGTFWPVGAVKERSSDVRVIAATNRDLYAVTDGSFREDLLFRLGVVTIVVPPLDAMDVKLLSQSFATEIAEREHLAIGPRALAEVAELAAGDTWRGGARELRSAIERYFLLQDENRSVAHNWRTARAAGSTEHGAGAADVHGVPPGDLSAAQQHLEDLLFLAAARSADGVRDLALRLRRSPQAVYSRLRKLGITPEEIPRGESINRGIGNVRRALTPHVSWIKALLTSGLEG